MFPFSWTIIRPNTRYSTGTISKCIQALADCTSTVSCIWPNDGSTERKYVYEFLILLPIQVVILTEEITVLFTDTKGWLLSKFYQCVLIFHLRSFCSLFLLLFYLYFVLFSLYIFCIYIICYLTLFCLIQWNCFVVLYGSCLQIKMFFENVCSMKRM
jgi:hypothetical protein